MRRSFLLSLALSLVLLPAATATAGSGESAPASSASARALSIRVVAPGVGSSGTAEISAPPDAAQVVGGFSFSGVSTGSLTANASASSAPGSATARASSQVSGITLFGGDVTVGQVSVSATANARSGSASGDVSASNVSGLVVLGSAASTGPGVRVPLGDWGYAVSLSQATSPTTNGYRTSVTGLELVLTAEHAGLPAGTQIQIGYAEAAAQAAPLPKRPLPEPPPVREVAPQAPAAPGPSKRKPGAKANAAPPILPPPPGLVPKLTRGGYVFPVYGPASFTNTFRGPRASTGWHHGEDIFAPLGAPVLAVADGTVFSVGWNDVGGNRLWLRDRYGTEYYYAHLSAFSPAAVNGARVTAGTVLGFVGTSGDAEGTPPHLHFEIHPAALKPLGYDGVIEPYPFLLAWERLEDIRVSGATWLPGVAQPSNAPTPGAFLLAANDISRASGLEPGSLRRALAETVPRGRDGTDAARALGAVPESSAAAAAR